MDSTNSNWIDDSRRRQRDEEGVGPEERPQQRARIVDPDETLLEDLEQAAPVRDVKFYRKDGNCILQVENVLFKIHRHLLDYPSSAFRGLFSLPRGAKGEREGEDDSRPICLSGDNPDDVRSFFHYAYSSPLALQYPSLSVGALPQLMGTLRFAHKYRLDSFEKWASKAITEICSGRDALKTCGLDLYIALLELDRLCSLPTVKGLIQRSWVSRLRENEAGLTLVRALEVADKFGFRSLQGDVYYLQLQKLDVPDSGIAGTHAAPPLPAELSDTHKLRLLTGYRSLLLAWARVTATPLMLEGTCDLGTELHRSHCARRWERIQFVASRPLPPSFWLSLWY